MVEGHHLKPEYLQVQYLSKKRRALCFLLSDSAFLALGVAVRNGGKRADGSVKATLVYKNYISVSCGSFAKPCRGRSLGNKRCHYTLAILLNHVEC